MSGIIISGIGAVSAAGWGVEALRNGKVSTETILEGGGKTFRTRNVPAAQNLAILRQPRLRRTSAISQYSVAAALEALGERGKGRVGLIFCAWGGCVNYSRRFYAEALQDAATASPLLFPETVFNAPASHVAAAIGGDVESYTLVGDSSAFLQGLAIGAQWVTEQRVEKCVVMGAEEIDWVIAHAFCTFHEPPVFTAGAGALCLRTGDRGVSLTQVTELWPVSGWKGRAEAARKAAEQLGSGSDKLFDGRTGIAALDVAEESAYAAHTGERVSIKKKLGEGFAATAALQCVAAVDALGTGEAQKVFVSVTGYNQAAGAAAFERI